MPLILTRTIIGGGFYAIDRNGKILPGWPVEKGWNFWSTPALGDVDGDGYLEISVGGYINGVISKNYLFRYDGSIMKGWPPQTTFYRDNYGSIIGDVNSDSKLDVLTTAGNGFYPSLGSGGVYAWDKDGSRIIGFPKPTEMDANAPAVLDDIDNDGKTELIASSDYDYDLTNFKPKGRGSVYVWNTNKTYNQANMPWPMFMHDPQHTGCYDCIEPSIIVTSPNGGETLEAGKSYDITWNSNGVDKAYIHLAVYNSNGVRAGLYYLAGGFSASLGKYTWKIPSYYALITNRSRSKIIISSTASITLPVNDSSDNYFSIAAPATNYCSQLQTRVTASMFKSCGQIDYSAVADINKDKAVNQYDQALLTANSNNETWCREKLNSTTSPCVVARPSVTITSPNGGEQLEIGKDYNITWTSSGVGQVNITAYNFSTLRVTTINIAQNVSAPSGSYVWTIPTGTATGTNVKITIRSTDGSVEDSTDNYFIIVE